MLPLPSTSTCRFARSISVKPDFACHFVEQAGACTECASRIMIAYPGRGKRITRIFPDAMATVVPLGRCSTADGLSKIAKSLTESRLGMGRPACNYKRSFIQLLECDDSRSGTSEMIGAVSTREGHASKSDLVDVGLDARASSYSL